MTAAVTIGSLLFSRFNEKANTMPAEPQGSLPQQGRKKRGGANTTATSGRCQHQPTEPAGRYIDVLEFDGRMFVSFGRKGKTEETKKGKQEKIAKQ